MIIKVQCPRCKGRGWIVVSKPQAVTAAIRCERCSGKGERRIMVGSKSDTKQEEMSDTRQVTERYLWETMGWSSWGEFQKALDDGLMKEVPND